MEQLRLKNFKVFQNAVMERIPGFCALAGPVGSGRHTLFDAFAFLQDCLKHGIGKALDIRGGFRGVASRGHAGEAIGLELVCRADGGLRLSYALEVALRDTRPVVALERLCRLQGSKDSPSCLFEYREGHSLLVPAAAPGSRGDGAVAGACCVPGHPGLDLVEPDMLGLTIFGEFADCRESCGLRRMLEAWQMPNCTGHRLANRQSAGTRDPLYLAWRLQKAWPDRFQTIVDLLRSCEPDMTSLAVVKERDGQCVLQARIAGFGEPFYEHSLSPAILLLFKLFAALHDPDFPQGMRPAPVCLEEPGRGIPPSLLPRVSAVLRGYARERQVLVATDSPGFLDTMADDEVYCLQKRHDGFSGIQRMTDNA